MQQFRLDLVFVHARPGRAHRAQMRVGGDFRGLAHQAQFAARLVQAQVVQQVRQRDEFVRRLRALAHLRAHPVDPADQLEVELGVAAEMIIDARTAFDQARQDVVDVVDRERVVHAERCHRALGADARTVPALAFEVTLAAEQDRLAGRTAGDQREHRVRLGEPGQIVEIAVLPVWIVRVVVAHAFRRGGDDHDRVVAGHAHQLAAAAREFLRFDHLGSGCRHCVSGAQLPLILRAIRAQQERRRFNAGAARARRRRLRDAASRTRCPRNRPHRRAPARLRRPR